MTRTTQVFAHRGAKSVAPENTLPAFQAALDMGVDGIELDVQCSKDGVLVVMHNFTVDETTDGHGRVGDFTATDLARLDAGSHFGASFAGVGVPTLEEVFALVAGRCRINVEIKSTDPLGGPEVDALAAMIRAGNLYNQVLVSSFNPISLIKMRWVDNHVPLALLYYGQPLPSFLQNAWFSPIMQPEAVHPHSSLVDATLMGWAKSTDVRATAAQLIQVNTWTVNDVEEARRLAALGVDAIITDVPDAIMAALD
jgi:glycerophosphoryl diester phosphodiesterase